MNHKCPSVPRLASTVLALRRRRKASLPSAAFSQFEVLFVQRHAKARFMANAFVFPGGCVEESDSQQPDPMKNAARWYHSLDMRSYATAALRELNEEVSLSLQNLVPLLESNDDTLSRFILPYSHWITPRIEVYRYDTHFFMVEVRSKSEEDGSRNDVQHDVGLMFADDRTPPIEKGVTKAMWSRVDWTKEQVQVEPEIVEEIPVDTNELTKAVWLTPQDAVKLHLDPHHPFGLPPTTFLSCHGLCHFATVDDVIFETHSRCAQCSWPTKGKGIALDWPCIEPIIERKGGGDSKKPIQQQATSTSSTNTKIIEREQNLRLDEVKRFVPYNAMVKPLEKGAVYWMPIHVVDSKGKMKSVRTKMYVGWEEDAQPQPSTSSRDLMKRVRELQSGVRDTLLVAPKPRKTT